MPPDQPSTSTPRSPLLTAAALSLGAAIALGLSRFSYGLLLPPMRDDLGWSYLLAGSMNTFNALGYFIGALCAPALLRRAGAWHLLMAGAVAASLVMLAAGCTTDATLLAVQRLAAGIASAVIFIAGGLLAARLGARHGNRAGLIIGLYYGGTGIGIALSALLVPAAMALARQQQAPHLWQWAWWAMAVVCLLATVIMARPVAAIDAAAPAPAGARPFAVRDLAFGLGSYCMFGVGYIGYMTFVVALLKQQGMQAGLITVFYALLGLAVVASSRIWARMLDRFRGGESLAILNALLGVVTILPALTSAAPVVFVSGLVFGGVFLSVVASTTALVRHNLPQAAWPAGISAFTTAFALGQIVGPSMIGWIADGPAGLERGLMASAGALLLAAVLGWRQPPLDSGAPNKKPNR
ncbi:MFS transporter [Duganella sp. Leaf126]|uniref:YbfB/YjiJ family MFS transporter n=1 Tax=Duganella sp. Leaf126 TaxID=1736266 RepID=UPI0006FB29C8|nr:YbfB/YjiJ family MFS transporter [Duganella sp. Leaf126]KQQ31912.1 MFS transporter [Duganella sp. Leaf126]